MSDNREWSADERLEAGVALEDSGSYHEAAATYQAVLGERPDDHVALFRLGRTMGKLGHRDLRLALLGQAVARAPESATYHEEFAEALLEAGYAEDALQEFDDALERDPACAGARAGRAEALVELGRIDEAEGLVAQLGSEERTGRWSRTLGRMTMVEGRHATAVDHFIAYLKGNPLDPIALFYLGVCLQEIDMVEPALLSYQEALALDPSLFEAWSNTSTVLLALGRSAEALVAAERALELMPERPGAWLNRANARRDEGMLAAAGDDYRRAVTIDPSYARGWSSLGNLYHDLGEWSLALDAHARAVDLAPTIPQIRWNRSFTLLATGDLTRGWEEYEARLETKAARPEARAFPWCRWTGEPIDGRRLLVWREQGLGDEILFAAALPTLLARGARVTFLASPRLTTVFARTFPAIVVIPDGNPGALAGLEFDYEVPLASLPRCLRLSRGDFDSFGPFLLPNRAHAVKWEERLLGLGPEPKIGICWRSGLMTNDRLRHYPPLDAWEPVFRTPGLVFVNLQYDDCAAELLQVHEKWSVRVHRWEGENLKDDLESTLGLIASLDAVVSAPTAVTSLSGAVGTTTWQVDSGSDWTVFGENRSPWFPAVRVIRRAPAADDWAAVMRELSDSIRAGPAQAD